MELWILAKYGFSLTVVWFLNIHGQTSLAVIVKKIANKIS